MNTMSTHRPAPLGLFRALSSSRAANFASCGALVCLSLLLGACSGGGAAGAKAGRTGTNARMDSPSDPNRIQVGDRRTVAVSKLTPGERQEIERAWSQFLAGSPLWRISLNSIVERGGAGPYVLSENLFRHFFQASIAAKRSEIDRVARSAAMIGEPAVAYFAKPLVEDLVPLGREVEALVPDPNDPKSRIRKTFRHFQIDDFTRRDAARVLVAIGEPAVATLASEALLAAARPSGRRYAAFALGRIGTDAAVAALVHHYETAPDWQDRAAAVTALGAAAETNAGARAALDRAAQDPDRFVREQAEKALTGRAKLPF
ncbi:MAG: HEAT repeat domain-containing protein [Planctomycetota bacterium]|nr:HEAT repeat domain-containing protein [Planctomycetota bacterium]